MGGGGARIGLRFRAATAVTSFVKTTDWEIKLTMEVIVKMIDVS